MLRVVLLAFLLLLAIGLSLTQGAVKIAPGSMLLALGHALGLERLPELAPVQAMVLNVIRLPRIVLGILVGATLGMGGAAMQGLFRNPLADPGLIGVSAGAGLGGAVMIVLGGHMLVQLAPELHLWLVPAGAFLGALLAMLAIMRLGRCQGVLDVAAMLLAGIALNALAGSLLGFLIFLSSEQQLREVTFWMMGSLAGAGWPSLLPALPFLILPLLILPFMARSLDALLLGEAEAFHLGFAVERSKALIVVATALGVGAAVALSGAIGFVGLLAPHLARFLVGPGHRFLLPTAGLAGAILLLLADLAARLVVLPAELPVGILTGLAGAPFFLYLLSRRHG